MATPTKTMSRMTSFVMTPKLDDDLAAFAEIRGWTKGKAIRHAIKRMIAEYAAVIEDMKQMKKEMRKKQREIDATMQKMR